MNFDTAFDLLISHEGGFSNRPFADDPGGRTMYGVTDRVARENGYVGRMEDLSLDFAKSIYRKKYWDACQCDAIPDPIKYPLFDAAVNSGPGQSIKWLQSCVGVKVDGHIGSVTLQAVNSSNEFIVRQQMIGKRLSFMTKLNNWSSNSRGWSQRIASILEM